jgi:hypothetical protein
MPDNRTFRVVVEGVISESHHNFELASEAFAFARKRMRLREGLTTSVGMPHVFHYDGTEIKPSVWGDGAEED